MLRMECWRSPASLGEVMCIPHAFQKEAGTQVSGLKGHKTSKQASLIWLPITKTWEKRLSFVNCHKRDELQCLIRRPFVVLGTLISSSLSDNAGI